MVIKDRLATRTLPDGTVENLTYTSTGRPDTVTSGSTVLVDFTHDDGSREAAREFANGLTMSKSYNTDNSLASVTTTGIATVSYTYDNRGNVTAEARTGTLSTYGYSSSYDNADRLTGWTRDNSDTQTWELSPVGDWESTTINSVTETRAHGPAHELTTRGMNSLAYDVKGNLTSDGTGKTLTWDFDNKLRSVDINSDSLADVEYVYDALGRRVEVVTYTGTGESRTSTGRVSVCAGQQVVAEYAHGADANSPLFRYTHSGLYVDDKVCRWQPGGEGGTYLYYHLNRQYSTVAITDSSGSAVEFYAYTPYGTVSIADGSGASLSASGYDQRFLYTGREWDADSRLWYFRARYLDSTQGRFIGRDPLGYVDGASVYGAYFAPGITDPIGMCCNNGKDKIADDTGETCCPEVMCDVRLIPLPSEHGETVLEQTVNRPFIDIINRPGEIYTGHTFIKYTCGGLMTRGWGFYPSWRGGGDGIVEPTGGVIHPENVKQPYPAYKDFNACPSTIRKLDKYISDFKDKFNKPNPPKYWVFDNTSGDNNYSCSSWSIETLENNGFNTGFFNPDTGLINTDPTDLARRCKKHQMPKTKVSP